MEYSVGFNLKELVGKDALEAYDTYAELKKIADFALFTNVQKDTVICDNYDLRDYNYPMDLVLREN